MNKIIDVLKPIGEFIKRNKVVILVYLLLVSVLGWELWMKFEQKRQTATGDKESNNISFLSYQTENDFAKYSLEKTIVNPSLPTYSISNKELTNLTNFEKKLGNNFSNEQKKALDENNFFVVKNKDKFWRDSVEDYSDRSDDWTSLYDEIGGENNPCYRNPEDAVFVSSDFLLHVYHRLLDKEFEYIEDTKLYNMLTEITNSTFEMTTESYKSVKTQADKESYQRIMAFLAIPKVILDSAKDEVGPSMADQNKDTDTNILANLEKLKGTIPAESYKMALAELKLVLAKEEIAPSPIFGKYLETINTNVSQDYTQFTPRSHYTKNSILRSYFRAMMWYGRNNFPVKSNELTKDAINLTLMIQKAGEIDNWKKIYSTTSFLAGRSDDLGIIEYQENLDKLEINETNVDDKSVAAIQTAMKSYQGPKIQSSVIEGEGVFDSTKEELLNSTKGFRFMGQRFTPDGFIFSSLTQGDEKPDAETGQSLPSSTTALTSLCGRKGRRARNS
jgi:predicted negative regulator of RcsB-dependent stress response